MAVLHFLSTVLIGEVESFASVFDFQMTHKLAEERKHTCRDGHGDGREPRRPGGEQLMDAPALRMHLQMFCSWLLLHLSRKPYDSVPGMVGPLDLLHFC